MGQNISDRIYNLLNTQLTFHINDNDIIILLFDMINRTYLIDNHIIRDKHL